jgi:hypothetical protein
LSGIRSAFADTLVRCWLRLQFAEQYSTAKMLSGCSFVEIEYVDAQLGRAQHRYLKALESLARVRKLLGPVNH